MSACRPPCAPERRRTARRRTERPPPTPRRPQAQPCSSSRLLDLPSAALQRDALERADHILDWLRKTIQLALGPTFRASTVGLLSLPGGHAFLIASYDP